MEELAPGLWRWTAWHPEWKEDVGSVAVGTADGLVFIDPLEPPAALGRPDHVLLTVSFHLRATAALKGTRVWASASSVRSLARRGVAVTDLFGQDLEPPGGISAFEVPRSPKEVVFWLPEQRAVVVGDVLLGAGAKPRPTDDPLRLCPERWLGGRRSHDELRASLRPLLELPVELVLVSHGEPLLAGGKEALAAALA
jgi:glyoxylase-like metal-dependent hydrolase (beta-lactamase superfamily II)